MAKNGLHLLTPTSTAVTGSGSSATINTNGSVTFSSCATLSLNGVFSADYDNYMIVMRSVWNGSGNVNFVIRLRASGTDNTTANSYTTQELAASGTGVSGARSTNANPRSGMIANTQRDGQIMYLYGPYLAQPTAYRGLNVSGTSSARIDDFAWTHNQSTAYDGLTIYPESSSFTGLLGVYGMRK